MRRNKKDSIKLKFLILLAVWVSSFFLSGCWDYKEFETLAMISAVGFDTASDASLVTVTVQYLVPSSGQGSSNAQSSNNEAVIKGTAASIDDALTEIQQISGKKLFYGYMQEIIIGESAAKSLTTDIIGYINRTPNIRTSALIAATDGKAEDVIGTVDPNSGEASGKLIHNILEQSINSGFAYPVTIQDFSTALAISGLEPVAPRIRIKKSENKSGSSSSSSFSGSSSGNSSGRPQGSSSATSNDFETGAVEIGEVNKGSFSVDGIAAFQGDKLVGWLEGRSCLGLGWARNKPLNAYEIVKTSAEQKIANTMIFRVSGSKCSTKVEIKNGKPVVIINAQVEADLRKFSKNVEVKQFTPDVMDGMEKALASNIRSEIANAVTASQKNLKSDIFGIGLSLYRQYPQLWHSKYEKDWAKIYPTVQIKVNASAKIIDTGTTTGKLNEK